MADAASPPAPRDTSAAKPAATPDKSAPAKHATSIPEPGNPTILFLLAAGGLALGRRLSRSTRRRSPDG